VLLQQHQQILSSCWKYCCTSWTFLSLGPIQVLKVMTIARDRPKLTHHDMMKVRRREVTEKASFAWT
jgi:hypothetical protein